MVNRMEMQNKNRNVVAWMLATPILFSLFSLMTLLFKTTIHPLSESYVTNAVDVAFGFVFFATSILLIFVIVFERKISFKIASNSVGNLRKILTLRKMLIKIFSIVSLVVPLAYTVIVFSIIKDDSFQGDYLVKSGWFRYMMGIYSLVILSNSSVSSIFIFINGKYSVKNIEKKTFSPETGMDELINIQGVTKMVDALTGYNIVGYKNIKSLVAKIVDNLTLASEKNSPLLKVFSGKQIFRFLLICLIIILVSITSLVFLVFYDGIIKIYFDRYTLLPSILIFLFSLMAIISQQILFMIFEMNDKRNVIKIMKYDCAGGVFESNGFLKYINFTGVLYYDKVAKLIHDGSIGIKNSSYAVFELVGFSGDKKTLIYDIKSDVPMIFDKSEKMPIGEFEKKVILQLKDKLMQNIEKLNNIKSSSKSEFSAELIIKQCSEIVLKYIESLE